MPEAPGSTPAPSRRPRWQLAFAAACLVAGVARGAPLVLGDILVTDQAADKLFRIDAGTGLPTELASAGFLLDPIGVAFRGDGFAFVTNVGSQLVVRVDPAPVPMAPVQVAISALVNIRGIVIDDVSGDAFVSSPSTDEILRIDAVTGISSPVASLGFIHFPTGLVREPNGDLVVADSSTAFGSAIVRIDAQDGTQTRLASAGLFEVLRDIEIDPTAAGSFLVVDSSARKIFRVDATIPDNSDLVKANQSVWAACPEFVQPRGIAVEPTGSVLVSDFSAQKVFRIQPTPVPRVCTALATGSALVAPWDVTVVGNPTPFDPTALLVADAGPGPGAGAADRVFQVDPGAGTGGTGVPLTADGALADPVAVTRDLNGDLLVIQSDRIFRVSTGGTQTLVAIITSDPGTEEPVDLAGIVVLKNGEILVTDTANDRLLRVIPGTGQQIVVADDDGTPPASLAAPAGLALDRNGTALVANRGRPEETPPISTGVVRVNPSSGTTTPVIQDAAFDEIVATALDLNGDYLIADFGNNTVWRLRASTPLTALLYPVSVGNQITSLRGIVVDVNRSILVSNQGTAKLLRLDPISGAQSIVAPDVPFTEIQGIALDQIPTPPDLDSDFDGHPETEDNCPEVSNPDQQDTDEDGLGDVCDDDDDGDGVLDDDDNCRLVDNPDQIDTNEDGFGNICDADYTSAALADTGDGVVNLLDFIMFTNAFLTSEGPPADPGYDPDIDANSDGVINVSDFVVFSSLYLLPLVP